jgi:hypothetical protein
MWNMTLKQRRRQRELVAQLDELKRDPYAKMPKGYTLGENQEEDEKYMKVLESLKAVVEEMHELEVTARDGD